MSRKEPKRMATSDLEPHEDGPAQGNRKGRQALSNVGRELSEEEFSSPAVQRMLLDELDRLETEVGELREFKDRFHSADKDAAVLGERLRGSVARDGGLAVGAAMLGLAPSLWSLQPSGWIIVGLGVALIVFALLAKRFWS